MGISLKVVVATAATSYFMGMFLSPRILPENHFDRYLEKVSPKEVTIDAACDKQLSSIISKESLERVNMVVHRNGEADPCGDAQVNWTALLRAVHSFETCRPQDFSKFDFESLVTRLLADYVESCDSDVPELKKEGFFGHCDRGEDRTPILLDHDDLVPIPDTETLPCRFHTREGVRISSLQQLSSLIEDSLKCDKDQTCSSTPQLHLYAVPAGRVFMHAPKFVGEVFELPHVRGPLGLPVSLVTLSVSPKIFDVLNFFTPDESKDLVDRALKETSKTHKIQRSTTGATGGNVNSQRTSENGFDTDGKTSMTVKKRCMEILGYDEYLTGHTDGLQILRYNLTTAYIPHMDWIDDPSGKLRHDYDSAGRGGNRYATILLYMSDLHEHAGGETVFAKAWPSELDEKDRVPYKQALQELRESGDAEMLEPGSWEEEMVAKCRSRLAIRPNSARAVLFYSQLPNGEPDPASLHGGCPVLEGEKWAANLWVWNTPRDGFDGSPVNPDWDSSDDDEDSSPTSQFLEIKAIFTNTGEDASMETAELFYNEDHFWGKLGKDDPPLRVNTYEGHKWNIKVNGEIVKSWSIMEDDGEEQEFTI